MKKTLFVAFLMVIFSFTSTGISYTNAEKAINGTAVCLGPVDGIKILESQFANLPNVAFKDTSLVITQKQTFANLMASITTLVEKGEYKTAINEVDANIRNYITNSIVDAEQLALIQNLENLIAAVSNASQTTVKTSSGKVAAFDASNDCWAWLGIPYAKPPVGNLRWKAPQDTTPWDNIRFPNSNLTPCVQPALDTQGRSTNKIKGSEDCLYLSVYRPKTSKKDLPVYFWIHGGGNFIGGAQDYFLSSYLSGKSDVVVVVIQYRLGPFGYFTHPSLNSCRSLEEKSGNFAVLDMVKALNWVHKNIEVFGGDSGNITIAGESAGGFNVLNLMTSPLAKGLFHRAIAQSPGGYNIPSSQGIERSNSAIDKMLVADGTCKDSGTASVYRKSLSNKELKAYLMKKTSEEIEKSIMDSEGNIKDVSPFIDGKVLPGTLDSVFKSGKYNKVPVIIGSNQSELKAWLANMLGDVKTSNGHTWSNIWNAIGLASPSITLDELMPADADKALYEDIAKYPTQVWKATMVDSLARLMREHQKDVYTYLFKWGEKGSGPSPFDFLVGAGHGFDLSFFFGWPIDIWGNISYTKDNEKGRVALQDAMMSYTSSFLRTGNPNKKAIGLPVWEQWSNKSGKAKSIVFNADYEKALISMMNQELRKEEVLAQIKALPDYEKELMHRLIGADFLNLP